MLLKKGTASSDKGDSRNAKGGLSICDSLLEFNHLCNHDITDEYEAFAPKDNNEPYHALFFAILERAARDVHSPNYFERKEAVRWIMSTERKAPFSFLWLIEHLERPDFERKIKGLLKFKANPYGKR